MTLVTKLARVICQEELYRHPWCDEIQRRFDKYPALIDAINRLEAEQPAGERLAHLHEHNLRAHQILASGWNFEDPILESAAVVERLLETFVQGNLHRDEITESQWGFWCSIEDAFGQRSTRIGQAMG